MEFALIRIDTTITKTKQNKTKAKNEKPNKTHKKATCINNRYLTAYKMLLWISTVFNLKT